MCDEIFCNDKHALEANIISIMAANTPVNVRFLQNDGSVAKSPVIGWALVQLPDGARDVYGLDASEDSEGVDLCETIANFDGYESVPHQALSE